jgi:hypothetical protein
LIFALDLALVVLELFLPSGRHQFLGVLFRNNYLRTGVGRDVPNMAILTCLPSFLEELYGNNSVAPL